MKGQRIALVALSLLAGIGLFLALERGPGKKADAASSTPAAETPTGVDAAAGDAVATPPAVPSESDIADGVTAIKTPDTRPAVAVAPPLFPGLHAAPSAREALKLIAQQPEGPDSVGYQRDVERLCLRARRDGRRREGAAPESWYAAQLQLQRKWCADLPPVEGDEESVERALLSLGPDRGDVLRERLGRSAGDQGSATAHQALSQSRDLYELTTALQHLDALGELGVPPHSLRDSLPAQLSDLTGIAAQWTLCAEAGPCGPGSWPVLRYCSQRNSCPPEADFYTAVRLSLGATQFEQLQWLTRQIAARRSNAARR